jgi:hypothetical protein
VNVYSRPSLPITAVVPFLAGHAGRLLLRFPIQKSWRRPPAIPYSATIMCAILCTTHHVVIRQTIIAIMDVFSIDSELVDAVKLDRLETQTSGRRDGLSAAFARMDREFPPYLAFQILVGR